MKKQSNKYRKYTVSQLLKAIVATVICGLLIVEACILKYYIIGERVEMEIWFCILVLLLAVTVFLGGQLVFVAGSRSYIIEHPRYYVAFLTVVTLTFLIHLFLSAISPLLIAPGLTAIVIVQLTRKKQDAFIFNLIESMMVLCAVLFESIVTDGEIFSVVLGLKGYTLWMLVGMTLVNLAAGAVIPAILRNKTSRANQIVVGGIVLTATVAVYVLMNVVHDDRILLLQYTWLAVISGAIPLVASLLVPPVVERIYNLVTDSRLAELTSSKQPLLKRLAAEAPGTYNHSLAVANFAEMCANAIGEDPYLARAAAYYHDVGKLSNPSYFAENQAGYNPHDDLLPEVSAEIIRKHTTDGYRMLKDSRLPEEIARVAIEHHGSLPITVFYERAKKLTDGEVDPYEYSYHGDTPTTKIAGIIMICDSSEAAIRAMDKPDGARVDKLLRNIIHARIAQGQFDRCKLSMKDIDVIRQTIINAYGGLFHTRVQYPDGGKA